MVGYFIFMQSDVAFTRMAHYDNLPSISPCEHLGGYKIQLIF